jgi:hypothetical protein
LFRNSSPSLGLRRHPPVNSLEDILKGTDTFVSMKYDRLDDKNQQEAETEKFNDESHLIIE